MGMANVLYLVFVLFYVFFLPGYLITRQFLKEKRFWSIVVLSFTLSMLVMPILSYSVAAILRTYVTQTLVLTVAVIINLILIKTFVKSLLNLRKCDFLKRENIILFAISILVFVFFITNFKGPTENYWDTYITAPAMFITNNRIDFLDIEGNSIYDYTLEGRLPQNLVDENTYGIITKDQRLGAGIFFSLPFLFYGIFGFKLFFAIAGVMISVFGFLIAKRIFGNVWLAVASSVLLSLNPFIISVNNLNANLLGLMVISAIIFLSLGKKINWFIIGLLYGVLGGIRNVALLFLPALLVWWYFIKGNKRQLLIFIIGALIAILPIIFWKQFAFGNVLMHPTQYTGLDGYRPTFEHQFIFWRFAFNGLLNYPFHQMIVRTPHFAFPNYLTIPLVLIRSFGIILSSLALFGVPALWKQNRKLAIFLIVFFVPFYFFLVVQENWEELKTTFVLLLFNPLIIFMTAGIRGLFSEKRVLNLLKLIVLSLILMLAVKGSFNLEFPQDERWYERFPHAVESESGLSVLSEEYRDGWQFFYTRETEEEYLFQKKKLTKGNLIPTLYEKMELAVPDTNDINRKELETLEVWNYIYS